VTGALEEQSRRESAGEEEIWLLGVRFDRLRRQRALDLLESMLGQGRGQKVFIVNAHTLNLSWRDPAYRSVLNDADLLLNDGSGVQLASWMEGRPFPDNLVGTDLIPEFCRRAERRGAGVFLLGGLPGTAERAAEGLRRMVPGLKVCGTHHGYFDENEEPEILARIAASKASILLVAFGNPLQERWIHRRSGNLSCDVCIGIGGLVDHLGGRLRRAPRWVRKLRMEWVHILLNQPHKWRRYLLGNPLFLIRVSKSRLGWGP
jgi:N-acetylglucosaminyldiphosphoundecaprenol N-acetyl-beta-D-mannosaminyltransferase